MSLQLIRVRRSGDLLIADWSLAAQLLEVRLQQLALVRVERLVLAVGVAPPIGKSRRDLARKESTE
jgi:hypothetical protein